MKAIGFLGPGGSGKTTMAVNIATCLTIAEVRTLLVDANFYLPSVYNHFGVEIPYSINDYLKNPELKPEWITIPVKFSNNLHILSNRSKESPTKLTDLLPPVVELLDRLGPKYGTMIVDFPPSFPIELAPIFRRVNYRILVIDPTRVPLDDLSEYIEATLFKYRPYGVILNFADLSSKLLEALVDLIEKDFDVPVLGIIPTRESLFLEPVLKKPACLTDEWLSDLGLSILSALGYI
jgi:MinD-like ATPase involved in chromosome partitioning or flagellar assembly